MDDLIQAAEKLAYEEIEKTGMPLKMHVELSTSKGIALAKSLNANIDVVHIGTLLMDCAIGRAIAENRITDHVQMGIEMTKELLEGFPDIDQDVKINIEQCVAQHHGGKDFYSLESEICCNADCYRFLSVKGFVIALRFLKNMEFEDLLKLLRNKVDEKWNALSLDECKKELGPYYQVVVEFLDKCK